MGGLRPPFFPDLYFDPPVKMALFYIEYKLLWGDVFKWILKEGGEQNVKRENSNFATLIYDKKYKQKCSRNKILVV